MNRIRPFLIPFLLALLLVATAGLLSGCGGGDDLDESCAEVPGQVPETRCREHRL